MSGGPGTIIPGQTITLQPVNRQTIPYADRPFVDARGMITRYGYQFLQRLGQGFVSTAENVGSVVTVVDTITADISTIEAEIAVIDAEIAALQADLTALPAPFPPPIDIVPGASPVPPALPPSFALDVGRAIPLPADPIPGVPASPLAPPPPVMPNMPPLSAAPLPRTSGWQLLGEFSPSGVASFPMIFPAGFERFNVSFQGLQVNTAGAFLTAQVSINGGASFITGATAYQSMGMYVAGSGAFNGYNGATSGINLTIGLFSASNIAAEGSFDLFPGTVAEIALLSGHSSGYSNVPGWYFLNGSGGLNAGGVVNALQMSASAGTMSGTFWLFGLP